MLSRRDFVPPLAAKLLALRPRRRFPSYAAACRKAGTYEESDIVSLVAEKTRRWRDTLQSTGQRNVPSRRLQQHLFVLASLEPQGGLEVIELGGGCGATYMEIEALFPGRIRRWSIVETPAMAAAGRDFGDDKLRFFDELGDAARSTEGSHLLMAEGVLQHTPDPLATLQNLLELERPYVYVSRTEVTPAVDPVITVLHSRLRDHGPAFVENVADRETRLAYTLIPEPTLRRDLRGYEQLLWFEESDPSTRIFGLRAVQSRMIGFLLKRHAEPTTPL